ncbi:MAG: hypothetical protein Q7R64_03875 [bacterium]|nr:hypothetical protein [bacterium]
MPTKIEVVMPKPTRKACKEILNRLTERNPHVTTDLPPKQLCRVVLTMWYYGYATARRKVSA